LWCASLFFFSSGGGGTQAFAAMAGVAAEATPVGRPEPLATEEAASLADGVGTALSWFKQHLSEEMRRREEAEADQVGRERKREREREEEKKDQPNSLLVCHMR
jgi:hypothetical protein